MNYLVTGGAGFIGSHITRALLEQGGNVRILDNFSSGKRENLKGLDVEIIEGDLRDASTHMRVSSAQYRILGFQQGYRTSLSPERFKVNGESSRARLCGNVAF